MILDLGRVAIFIPFRWLHWVIGFCETSGSQNAGGTLVAKENGKRFL
jgi:hypothetical protein